MYHVHLATLLVSLLLAGTTTVVADPVPDPPSDDTCPKVFCFKMTDIRKDNDVKDRFHFEFQVLNWADTYAGGLELTIAAVSSNDLNFAEPLFDGIDIDGRPLFKEDVNNDGVIDDLDMEDKNLNGELDVGEDLNWNNRLDNDPIPGNLRRDNTWTLKSQSNTKMVWELGESGTPIPFINLLGVLDNPNTPGTCNFCITSIGSLGRITNPLMKSVTVDNFGTVSPAEAIDNGDNVQDGFVMTIDNFRNGKMIHLNWFLLGAGDATTNFETQPPAICRQGGPAVALGDTIGTAGKGNSYGFGLISLTRADDGNVRNHKFVGNIGFAQNSLLFFDGVFNVPNKGGSFFMEFAAGLSASFRNPGDNNRNAPVNAVVHGDPHFKTWRGQRFSFQGKCDLVLARSATFGNGLGIDIHIRTTLRDYYSFVSDVAIRIGDHVLEVNRDMYRIDGIEEPLLPATVSGFSVTRMVSDLKGKPRTVFNLKIDEGTSIVIAQYKFLLSVSVLGDSDGAHFFDSEGLLGRFEDGVMIGRDGVSVISNADEYGAEWQVRDTDPTLFHLNRDPQYPAQCLFSSVVKKNRRRLRAHSDEEVSEAELACAHHENKVDKEDCVFDVLATGDIDMAWESNFFH